MTQPSLRVRLARRLDLVGDGDAVRTMVKRLHREDQASRSGRGPRAGAHDGANMRVLVAARAHGEICAR